MGKVLYPVVFEFYLWQTRMRRVCNELPIKYLEKKELINSRRKTRAKSWSYYFYFW